MWRCHIVCSMRLASELGAALVAIGGSSFFAAAAGAFLGCTGADHLVSIVLHLESHGICNMKLM